MVGHQAVADDPRAGPPGRSADQVEIGLIIRIAEEHRLTPVAALGDVVRQAGARRAMRRLRASWSRRSQAAVAERARVSDSVTATPL